MIRPYPEWRMLWEKFGTTIQPGVILTYEELTAAMNGLDSRRGRGYRQLRRFFREVDEIRGLKFTLRLRLGYDCAPIERTPALVMRQVGLGGRRLRIANRMAKNTIRSPEATDATRATLSDQVARMSHIIQLASKEMRTMRRLVAGCEPPALTAGESA